MLPDICEVECLPEVASMSSTRPHTKGCGEEGDVGRVLAAKGNAK